MSYPDLFSKCLIIILKNEGGYCNIPADPGGPTNMGIIQRVYDKYRLKRNLSIRPVKQIELSEVEDIYYSEYWVPMNLEDIGDDNLILEIFDMGVNAGPRISIKLLQRIVYANDDGYIGPNTIKLIKSYSGDILKKFKDRRKIFYMNLVAKKPELEIFLTGWLRRVDRTKF